MKQFMPYSSSFFVLFFGDKDSLSLLGLLVHDMILEPQWLIGLDDFQHKFGMFVHSMLYAQMALVGIDVLEI